MFEQHTWQEILGRMLQDFKQPGVAKQEGTFVYDALSPMALELSQAYADLDRVLEQGFAQTSSGVYLDMRAAEHGLIRKPPAAAKGVVMVSGEAGTVIERGTLFSTQNSTLFKAVEKSVIADNRQAEVKIEAVDAGAGGNVPANTIIATVASLPGITGVRNELPLKDGYDGESDDALLGRLLAKVQKPATSGNANQYRGWALEVAGIADAKVYPVWNGNGTVKVVLLDEQRRAPSAEVVAETAEHIERVRPIGASVTVVAAKEIPVDIQAVVTLAPGASLAEVKQKVEEGVRAYLRGLAFADSVVRVNRMANIILDTPSVVDFKDFKVNDGTDNIVIPEGSVAVLGQVTLT